MKSIIVITGTPCTGKSTVSERLAKAVRNCELIKANELLKEKKLYSGRTKDGELIARMGPLRAEILKRVKGSKADLVIVEGHLLCDMDMPGATAIVIREHLRTLLKRMRKRGYGNRKIEDNIVSEAIDYCGVNAAENYMSVYEVMGGSAAVKDILGIIKGTRKKSKEIDMLGELNGLAKGLGKAVL